jgi:acyl-coenzyme A thioesterase PaaI-like protein
MKEMEWIKFLGVEPLEYADGRAVIRLVPKPVHLNHNKTVNAPVLYGLAEVAGAGAVVGGMLEVAARAYTVVKSAAIDYLAPARGTVTATGSVDLALLAAGRERVMAGEPAEVPAEVGIVDETDRVTTRVTLTMAIRPRRQQPAPDHGTG